MWADTHVARSSPLPLFVLRRGPVLVPRLKAGQHANLRRLVCGECDARRPNPNLMKIYLVVSSVWPLPLCTSCWEGGASGLITFFVVCEQVCRLTVWIFYIYCCIFVRCGHLRENRVPIALGIAEVISAFCSD